MGYKRYSNREERDALARAMRAEGLSIRKIAGALGCNYETVYEAVEPEAKERYNARRAAHNTSPEGLQRQRDYRVKRASERLDQGND